MDAFLEHLVFMVEGTHDDGHQFDEGLLDLSSLLLLFVSLDCFEDLVDMFCRPLHKSVIRGSELLWPRVVSADKLEGSL